MNNRTVIRRLRRMVQEEGGQNALARKMGINPGYLSHLLAGHKVPGDKVLRALGYRRTVTFVRAEGAK